MADGDRGAAFLDSRAAQIITDQDVNFDRFLNHEERQRIIPAAALADEGKRLLMLGNETQPGLELPWRKASGKVKIAPGKLCLWVGWSHHGKSQMLKQLMLHSIYYSERVCIASMEEEVHDIWQDMAKMACGNQEPGLKQVDEWVSFCRNGLWLYDQQGDVRAEKILAVMRYCATELRITQFVIDSLMMLAVSRDDYEAQSKFVGQLKTLAKDTGCTAHLVAHMRKRDGNTGEDKPGSMHDIAGGHEIGSKADYIFNVWRDRKGNNDYPCVLGVDKQRGRTNWIGRLGLNYHESSRQFVEENKAMKFWTTQAEESPL